MVQSFHNREIDFGRPGQVARRSTLGTPIDAVALSPTTSSVSRQIMINAAPPFGITVCGIEELAGNCSVGASHVLSILDPDSPVPEAFGAFGEHEKLELRFDDIIEDTPGMTPPQRHHVERILAFGRKIMAQPRSAVHLLVHCHAGISRSTASMALLIAQALPEQPASAIVASVHHIREKAWPNLRLMELGDSLLNRNGALVQAASALHRLQLGRRPHLAEFMAQGGRGREIAAALAQPPVDGMSRQALDNTGPSTSLHPA